MLRWRDVDPETGVLSISRAIVAGEGTELVEKVTKTHATRRVALVPGTVELLQPRRHVVEQRAAACGTAVAGRLGHAKAATTLNVYAHVVESSHAEAAQILGDLLRRT